ncbi:MAG: coenzyme F420-0:L-glutamate ligase [Bdellovibrionales bacterium]
MLQVKPIKTSIFRAGDDLVQFLKEHLQGESVEGHIVAVTSKIVSLAENRLVPISEISKEELIKKESDVYLGPCGYDCHLTIKEGLLIPSAGIDESNSEVGNFILYPNSPFDSAKYLVQKLRKNLGVEQLGVILTDSKTSPLRTGVGGVALAYYGFRGVKSLIGTEDLFGRPLKNTKLNIADTLAAAATLCMGEGSESCPIAIIKYPVEFIETQNNDEIRVAPSNDLYWSLLQDKKR